MISEIDRGRVTALFQEIRAAFPSLTMALAHGHPHFDLNMDIPRQPGLAFDVNLNLQGDELHLTAGSFWLEWFPCTDSEVAARYREAVLGLLSGRFRIVEHFVGERAVQAELQRPEGNAWQTIGTWSNLWIFLPLSRTTRVLQNSGAV